MLSDKDWVEAEERGRLRTLTIPCAVAARYDSSTGIITVEMNRGFAISFHKNRAQALHDATDEQLSIIEVEAPDWSIFFPKLQDGLSVEGMLAGRFGSRRWEREWADANGVQVIENAPVEDALEEAATAA